ncbi:hypothetical protein WDW86_04900 [Bdellovibrionota bacterium FG-2]
MWRSIIGTFLAGAAYSAEVCPPGSTASPEASGATLLSPVVSRLKYFDPSPVNLFDGQFFYDYRKNADSVILTATSSSDLSVKDGVRYEKVYELFGAGFTPVTPKFHPGLPPFPNAANFDSYMTLLKSKAGTLSSDEKYL